MSTTTTTSSAAPAKDSQSKPAAKIRKRAPKACLSCRARKVRCDVSQRGRPCMNCYLDSETCVVTGRASRFRRAQREGHDDAQISHPPYNQNPANPNQGKSAEELVRSRDSGEPPAAATPHNHNHQPATDDNPSRTEKPQFQQPIPTSEPSHTTHAPPRGRFPHTSSGMGLSRCSSPMPHSAKAPAQLTHNNVATFMAGEAPLWVGDQRIAANADVTYSYYRFLNASNIHNVLPQDVNYLESQGCLRVPTRAILDEFMQQYFLHVHPILPLINEGDFWDLYCQDGSCPPNGQFSLVVLQGMLFSSCNFVSKNSIKALGFPSIRAARATFYRRTKLLYDLDVESSLMELAQTALFLSFWSPNVRNLKKPNSAWLGVAIQNAKSVEAHLQSAMPTYSQTTHPVQYKRQNSLRRLWWCCFIRDRILPLGLRRSIQITRATFDLDSNPGLGFPDLADEVGRSRVYDPDTKRCLIEVLMQMLELCIVLTDLLTLVFPLDDAPGWGKQGSDEAERLRECKTSLRRWYKGATLRFPMFGGGAEPRMVSRSGNSSQHESVILFTNLMYMYYHSARVALCHHEVLQLAVASATPNLNNNLREFSNIFENRHELQDAASGVTECLKELIQLDLARWLPISAVASTALPLVLHIIDFKLSTHNKRAGSRPDPELAKKQHRLNILIEAMKTYQPQYDGVDYVSETVRHIVTLAQLDPPVNPVASSLPSTGGQSSAISEWADILASQPGCYLRLAMTMDLSLSKGRLPEESDFPASLRGLFTAGFSSVRMLLDQGRAPQAPVPQAFMPPTAASSFIPISNAPIGINGNHGARMGANAPTPRASIVPGTVHSLSSDEDSSTSPASLDSMMHNASNGQHQQQAPAGDAVLSSGMANQQPLPQAMTPGGMAAPDDMAMSDEFFQRALNMDLESMAGEFLAAYSSLNADQTPSSEEDDDDDEESFDDGEYIDTTGANPMDVDVDTGAVGEDWIGKAWGTDVAAGEGGGGGGGMDDTTNHQHREGSAMGKDIGEKMEMPGSQDTAAVLLDALKG